MGSRANLIIVEGDTYRLYYSHWCANTITRDIFWGPEYGLEFIKIQQEMDESGWLNDVWAEGGALVDLSKKTLLIFGGEDLLFDIPLRRVYLEMLKYSWKGWEILWAHEGVADLADYIGYPRENVIKYDNDIEECELSPPKEKDWTHVIGGIRFDEKILRFYPLSEDVEVYLEYGEALLNTSNEKSGVEILNITESKEFPVGGFHIDMQAKTVDFWSASLRAEPEERIGKRWPGWTVKWHKDRYESQLELSRGLLRFPLRSSEELISHVKEILLRPEKTQNPAVALVKSGRMGDNVKINPYAIRYDILSVDIEIKKRILRDVLERCKI